MKHAWYCVLPLVIVLTGPTQSMAQDWVLGIGPGYSMPREQFKDASGNSFAGGTASLMNRHFCHLWFGLRADYFNHPDRGDQAPPWYTYAAAVSPELRNFFDTPSDLPLYLQGLFMLSYIRGGEKEETADRLGMGWGAGVGVMLFYPKHCCDWFIDLNARWQVPNNFTRGDGRPILPSLLFTVSLNFAL